MASDFLIFSDRLGIYGRERKQGGVSWVGGEDRVEGVEKSWRSLLMVWMGKPLERRMSVMRCLLEVWNLVSERERDLWIRFLATLIFWW